jgi:hypothetical protein
MTTDNDDAENQLARMKKEMAKKKPKMAVPAEFLDNAKSYDDKVTLVKILTEKEKHRVVLMFKKMIQSGIAESNQKKGLK